MWAGMRGGKKACRSKKICGLLKRGYIATARKNGVGAYRALLAAFQGNSFIPDAALTV